MYIVSLVLKIMVSTSLVYLTIYLVERGNHRNTMLNSFVTAAVLNLAAEYPFLLFAGLVVWMYVLINWYSMGFLKSVVSVMFFGVSVVALNIFIVLTMGAPGSVYSDMVDVSAVEEKAEEFYTWASERLENVYRYLGGRMDVMEGKIKEVGGTILPDGKARIVFNNGRSIECRILMEGESGYLVDIADGKSEIFVPKDTVDRIERNGGQ